MNPKKTCDYAEVFDGVPSLHDGKSAMLLARLHLEGFSRRWIRPTASRQDLQALAKEVDLYQDSLVRNLNRFEAWAARHWPELGEIMDLGRTTVLKLLGALRLPVRGGELRGRSQSASGTSRRSFPELEEGELDLAIRARDRGGSSWERERCRTFER